MDDLYLFQPDAAAPPYLFEHEADARAFTLARGGDPDLDVVRCSPIDRTLARVMIAGELLDDPDTPLSADELRAIGYGPDDPPVGMPPGYPGLGE